MTCVMCADGMMDWSREKHTEHEIIMIKNINSKGTGEITQQVWTLAIYVSYLSVAVVKHHEQGSLLKNHYI